MPHIFVSHSTAKEIGTAEERLGQWVLDRVAAYLEEKAAGQYFLDRRSLAREDYFRGPILDNLGRATLGIVLATSRAIELSNWVHFEAGVLYWRKFRGERFHLKFILIPKLIRPKCISVFSALDFQHALPLDIDVPKELLAGSWPEIKAFLDRAAIGLQIDEALGQWIDAAGHDEPEPHVQRLAEIIENLQCRLLKKFVLAINPGCEAPEKDLAMVAAKMLSAATLNPSLTMALAEWCSDSAKGPAFTPIFDRVRMTITPSVLAVALNAAVTNRHDVAVPSGCVVRVKTYKHYCLLDRYLDRALGLEFERGGVDHQRYVLSHDCFPGNVQKQLTGQIVQAFKITRPMREFLTVIILDAPFDDDEKFLDDEKLLQAAGEAFALLRIRTAGAVLVVVHDADLGEQAPKECIDFAGFRPSEDEEYWEDRSASLIGHLSRALDRSFPVRALRN